MNVSEEDLAIDVALLEGVAGELAAACDLRATPPGRGAALVFLAHGTPEAQVAFGAREDVARELGFIEADEGPFVLDAAQAAADLMRAPPSPEGALLCVVVAAGRARLHEIPWPRAPLPRFDA